MNVVVMKSPVPSFPVSAKLNPLNPTLKLLVVAVKLPEALTVYGPSRLAVKVALIKIVPVRV